MQDQEKSQEEAATLHHEEMSQEEAATLHQQEISEREKLFAQWKEQKIPTHKSGWGAALNATLHHEEMSQEEAATLLQEEKLTTSQLINQPDPPVFSYPPGIDWDDILPPETLIENLKSALKSAIRTKKKIDERNVNLPPKELSDIKILFGFLKTEIEALNKKFDPATLHHEEMSQEEAATLPQDHLIRLYHQAMKQATQILSQLNAKNVILDQNNLRCFTIAYSFVTAEFEDLIQRSNADTLPPKELIANQMSKATVKVFDACKTFKSILIDYEDPPEIEDIQEADQALSELTSVIGELIEKADLHEELETKIEDLIGQISALTDRRIIINDDQ